jgi:hypothetical protein
MATIQEQLNEAKRKAEEISSKVGTLGAAEKEGLEIKPETTVQGAETFLRESPKRLPAESIEDFTKRIETGGTAPPPEGGAKPAPAPAPAVGTSDAERFKQREKELRESLGLGGMPQAPDLFGETDKAMLETARKERETIQLETEKILEERLTLEEQLRQFKATAGEGVSEAGRVGMVSEKERGVQNQLDALNRRELVLETKLRNRNSTISELMGLQKQEYSDAVAQYNTAFSQAVSLYGIIDKDEDELKINAKASLDVLSNAYKAQIEAGKFKIEDLTPMQKVKLEELEVQAGLPQGSTLAVLQTLKPGEEKMYSGVDSSGVFHLITKDKQGKLSHKTIEGIGATGVSDDIKEYNFYVQQETTEGRKPLSFLEYMQRKGSSGIGQNPEMTQDLIHAQAAIGAGVDEDAVRQRFLQKFPGSGKIYDDYFQE